MTGKAGELEILTFLSEELIDFQFVKKKRMVIIHQSQLKFTF